MNNEKLTEKVYRMANEIGDTSKESIKNIAGEELMKMFDNGELEPFDDKIDQSSAIGRRLEYIEEYTNNKKFFVLSVKQIDGTFVEFSIGNFYKNKKDGSVYKLTKIETFHNEVGGRFVTTNGRGRTGFWKDISSNFHNDYEEVKSSSKDRWGNYVYIVTPRVVKVEE